MSPMAPKVRLLFLRILFTKLLFCKKIHLWNFLLTVPQMYDIIVSSAAGNRPARHAHHFSRFYSYKK